MLGNWILKNDQMTIADKKNNGKQKWTFSNNKKKKYKIGEQKKLAFFEKKNIEKKMVYFKHILLQFYRK